MENGSWGTPVTVSSAQTENVSMDLDKEKLSLREKTCMGELLGRFGCRGEFGKRLCHSWLAVSVSDDVGVC